MGNKFPNGADIEIDCDLARCLLPFHWFESSSKYVGMFPVTGNFASVPRFARFLHH